MKLIIFMWIIVFYRFVLENKSKQQKIFNILIAIMVIWFSIIYYVIE